MYAVDLRIALMSGRYPPRCRAIMARVVLNTILDPRLYPVDLDDLCNLTCPAYALTRSFLDRSAVNAWHYGSGGVHEVADWKAVLQRAEEDIAQEMRCTA